MQSIRWLPFALALSIVAGCTPANEKNPERGQAAGGSRATPTPVAERKYLLERVDDAAVVQLYADGFAALPLREKTLIYHLAQAAIAGRDIYFDQRHRHALDMRGVLESMVTHPQGVDSTTLAEIQRYTKLFWINSGPYDLTGRKFVLKTTPAAFAGAARAAAASGASFPTQPGESLDALLARLQPMFFDPGVDPMVTNKNPGDGQDILRSSANNLYVDVGMADLKGFTDRYGLNSRLVRQNGRLVEEVYRIGGRYSKEITAIVRHLDAAIPYAPAPTADALRALVHWYRTGEDADRQKRDIAWVQDRSSPVDTINGFVEVYMDPRGVKGAWEGVVFYVNRQKTERMQTFARNAQWFEDHMPFDARYRKPDVRGIVANAIDVVMETGDAGPVSPGGINLPNDQRIREEYGSKSVSLSNVREARERSTPALLRTEFAWTAEEAARAATFASLATELHTDMHEVIGHGSGRQAPGFHGTPQAAIKEHYSAIEEGRADLIALYFIADPKLVELGIIPAADRDTIVRAAYEQYTRNAMTQLQLLREGTQLEEDHMRNRQMIVRWLMANTGAIEQRQRDGKTYLVMVDPRAFHTGVGRLLAEVQRIKSEGDAAAAAALLETHGIRIEPKLRDEVVARVDALNLPSYTGFVMPKLTPVTGSDGAITDVVISYPQDLTAQMLEFSK